MKLQELFKSVDFDKMFEFIVKFDRKMVGSRSEFLNAYKLLCDMPIPEAKRYGEIEVVPNPYKDDDERKKEFFAWCPDLEGCNWEGAIGAEVVYSPKLHDTPPMDMIAGLCLWHLTFYGFCPEDMEDTFEQMIKQI